MKTRTGFLILTLFAFGGWTGIQVKPAVSKIKKISIVSLSMNRGFYDVASPRKDGGAVQLTDLLKKGKRPSTLGASLFDDAESERLLEGAVKSYSQGLGSVPGWELVPPPSLVNPAKPPDDSLAVASGYEYVPLDALLGPPQGLKFVNGKKTDPAQEALTALAQKARDWGVDALAVIHLDMGYKVQDIGTVISGKLMQARPSVGAAVVIVTADGETAAKIPADGKRYEGKTISYVEKGGVSFFSDRGKALESYSGAVGKAAEALRAALAKKTSKP